MRITHLDEFLIQSKAKKVSGTTGFDRLCLLYLLGRFELPIMQRII